MLWNNNILILPNTLCPYPKTETKIYHGHIYVYIYVYLYILNLKESKLCFSLCYTWDDSPKYFKRFIYNTTLYLTFSWVYCDIVYIENCVNLRCTIWQSGVWINYTMITTIRFINTFITSHNYHLCGEGAEDIKDLLSAILRYATHSFSPWSPH